jgi:hypothetical protein
MSKLVPGGELSVSLIFILSANTPLSFSLTRIFIQREVEPVDEDTSAPVSPLTSVIMIAPRHALGLAHETEVPPSVVPPSVVPPSVTMLPSVEASVEASLAAASVLLASATGGLAASRGGVLESTSSMGSSPASSSSATVPLAQAAATSAAVETAAKMARGERRPMRGKIA